MSIKLCLLILFLIYFPLRELEAKVCQTWFESAEIKKGENCLIDCSILKTDMGTFHCPNLCANLCKISSKEHLIFNISYLYGLTAQERALSAKYPKKMLKGYQLSRQADKLCLNLFKTSRTNDESDACRHFVWAILLYKEFGLDFSKKVLNAHEQTKKQPLSEKSMDLANNRMGLITAEQLSKENQLNDSAILKAFQKRLKSGNLIILKKNYKNIKLKGGLK